MELAVLGPAFTAITVLCKVVTTLIETTVYFKEIAQDIKQKCERLLPLIEDLEKRNTNLKLSNRNLENFIKDIEMGLELLRKCSKVRWWDFWNKNTYSRKLKKLDATLKTWLEILFYEQVRDGKESLRLLSAIHDRLTIVVAVPVALFGIALVVYRGLIAAAVCVIALVRCLYNLGTPDNDDKLLPNQEFHSGLLSAICLWLKKAAAACVNYFVGLYVRVALYVIAFVIATVGLCVIAFVGIAFVVLCVLAFVGLHTPDDDDRLLPNQEKRSQLAKEVGSE